MEWSGYFFIVLYDELIDGMAIANNPKLKVRSEQLYNLVVHLFVCSGQLIPDTMLSFFSA
jgi:hypothetical protein